MTNEQLKSYKHIDGEIRRLDDEIALLMNRKASAVVRASSPEHPFTEHGVTVRGFDKSQQGKINAKYLDRAELIRRKREIEDYVFSVKDIYIRQILHWHYIKGFSWTQTAMKLGGKNTTSDSIRMMCKRFLNKKF